MPSRPVPSSTKPDGSGVIVNVPVTLTGAACPINVTRAVAAAKFSVTGPKTRGPRALTASESKLAETSSQPVKLRISVMPLTVAVSEKANGSYFDHYNFRRPHQALSYRTPAEVYLSRQPKSKIR